VLGKLDNDGTMLMGIDLDRCVDADDYIESWMVEVLDRFDTYAEVSPSGNGLKVFFFVAPDDARAVVRLFGTNERGEPKTRKALWPVSIARSPSTVHGSTPLPTSGSKGVSRGCGP
jgi:hypothetical protein